jgi:CheY-like chemotaxis protein
MQVEDKRIFLVEDNVGTCALIQLLLEQQGAQVFFGYGGTSILAALSDAEPIDLIILDLMLWDGITGHNIYDDIRSLRKYNNIPILAVSAADPDTAIQETKARGFSGFIGKPIDYNLFPKLIAQVLAGESIWFVHD